MLSMSTCAMAGLRGATLGLLLAVAAGAWPSGVSAQAGKPEGLYYKSWAIIIGIEEYLVAPKLPGTISDAKAVAKVLRELGFDEIIELYDKDASTRQLHHILKEYLPRKVGRQDRLVFYFAGHAGMTRDMDGKDLGYLVPWDSPLGNVRKALTLHQLKNLSSRIMSKHILFVLDTDVAGWEVTPAQQLSLEGRMAPEDFTEKRAVQVLTAAAPGEPVIRNEGRGLFVQTLLAGLQGASARDRNGHLRASQLAAYVSREVQDTSGNVQHPQFARLSGDGDMILREGMTGPLGAGHEPETDAERKQAAQTLYNQVLVDLQNRQPVEDALARLNQALAYDPTFGNAYVLKSFVLLDLLPNLEGALIAGAQAVEYASDNPDSHFTFGLVLQRMARFEEAERAFLEALLVNPSYTDVYLTLGDLYAQDLQDQAKSFEAYEQYLRLGGTENRARKYLEEARRGRR